MKTYRPVSPTVKSVPTGVFSGSIRVMLPAGYTGVIITDGRRSKEWEHTLAAEGFDVRRVATSGSEREKGPWQIGVSSDDELSAREFVNRVIHGEAQLQTATSGSFPRFGRLFSIGPMYIVAVAILAVVVAKLLY